MLMNQANTNTVLMIRPTRFGFNHQTAVDNAFQQASNSLDATQTQQAALNEFDSLVSLLNDNGVDVITISDKKNSSTPDSIFPNNWISSHQSGELFLYPMYAENRRREVRQDIIKQLKSKFGFKTVTDWTNKVNQKQFLEGTGSLVLDRKNQVAYAALSERTNLELAQRWAAQLNYELVSFEANDDDGQAIYHSNVLMSVAEHFAVVCFECLPNQFEREQLKSSLSKHDKQVIELSFEQIKQFAGNALELKSLESEHLFVMSQSAFDSLTNSQKQQIEQFSKILSAPIPTIESNGGGSVRCMIAEIFKPTT